MTAWLRTVPDNIGPDRLPEAGGPGSGVRPHRGRVLPRSIGPIATALVLAVIALLPVGYLIFGSFRTAAPALPGGWTLSKYSYLGSSAFIHLALNSLLISVCASVVGYAIALALALIVARIDIPFRRSMDRLIVIPGYVPPFMIALAWTSLLAAPSGYLNSALAWVGLPKLTVYSLYGIVLVMALCAAPVAYLYLRPALLQYSVTLEEAARTLGSGPTRTLRLITLKMATPALLSTALVVFVTTLGEFAVPAILGPNARIYTISTQLYTFVSEYPDDPNKASVLGLVLITVSVLGLAVNRRIMRGKDYFTVTGRAAAADTGHGARLRYSGFALCALFVLLTVVLPLGAIVIGSLQPFLSTNWEAGWTLHNYAALASYPGVETAIVNTIELAALAALIGISISLAVARYASGGRSRLGPGLEQTASLPLAVPPIVFGLALLWAWISIPVGIYGTKWILLIAYLGLFVPYGVRACVTAQQQLDPALEEAARVNGARSWRVATRIRLPLLAPAVLSGATIIMYHTMRELAASLLLYSPGNQVMSVQIWDLYSNGNYVELFAFGLLNIALVLMLVGLANLAIGRKGWKR